MRNNDLDVCLQVVSRSCQPLRYIRRYIRRKLLDIEAWFQRTTNGNGIWTGLELGLPDLPYFTGAPVFQAVSPASRLKPIRETFSPVF